MKINLKAGVCAFAGVCLITAMLGACTQRGTQYGTRTMPGTQNVGFTTNLAGTTRTNLYGATGINMYGTTGVNMYGTTGTNLYGTTGTNLYGTTGTNLYGTTRTAVPGTTGTRLPGTTGTKTPGYRTGTSVGYTTTTGTNMVPNQRKAEQIKHQVMKVNGVKNANVVVIGNTALVGCKTSPKAKNVSAVKSAITKKVKEADRSITNVTVSDSTNVMNRISKLNSDITSNKPMNTIVNEFNKLVKGM